MAFPPLDRTLSAVFAIARGAVRLYRPLPDGRVLALRTLHVDAALGVLDGEQDMLARSMARASREGAVIFRLPRSHLLGYGSAGLRASAEEHVWMWLREIEERLEDTLAYDLHSRLARLLARLAAEDAHQMVWETHEELAALLGAHREDVSKAISHIRALDLVRTHQGQRGIKVIDPARLSKC